jgi:hypothetical protein
VVNIVRVIIFTATGGELALRKEHRLRVFEKGMVNVWT